MKARSLSYLVGTVFIITLFFIPAVFKSFNSSKQQVGITAEENTNPEGRAEWEWKRLRNPQTNSIPENVRQRELALAKALPKKGLSPGLGKTSDAEVLEWQRRGPYNVGGRTRALGIDVDNEDIILAGGVSGGMWRSTDGGNTWTMTTDPAQLHSVTCLVQDTRDGETDTWYYGTGEYTGNSADGDGYAYYRGDGMFKSTDGGLNWELLSPTSTNQPQSFDQIFDFMWNIEINSQSATKDEIYAATYGAVQRSVDGGDSWSSVLGGSSPWSRYTDVAVTNNTETNELLITEDFDSGTYPSEGWTNGTSGSGNTWILANFTNYNFSDIHPTNAYSLICQGDAIEQNEAIWTPEFSLEDEGSYLNFYANYDSNDLANSYLRLLITTDSGSSFTELWRYSDDGKGRKWRPITVDLSNYAGMSGLKLIWQYAGSNGQNVGLDGIAIETGATPKAITYATLDSQGDEKGIWRSTDGINWIDISPPDMPTVFHRVVIGIAPSNEDVVYFLGETPNTGFINSDSEGHSLWKYTYLYGDGSGSGGYWENRSANLPAYGGSVGDYDSQGSYDMLIMVKPDDENVVFIGGTNLYRSTNGFATTTNTSWIGGYSPDNDVTQYDYHHPDLHSYAFYPSNPNIMLSGHDGGLSKTTNNLASNIEWSTLNNGYLTTQFYTIALDHATENDPNIIGGLQDNGNWYTTEVSESTSWSEMPFGGDGSYCYIGNGRGSWYFSTQNGKVRRYGNDLNNNLGYTRIDPVNGGESGTSYLFINPFLIDPNNSDRVFIAGGDRIWRNNDVTQIPINNYDKTSINWDELTNTIVSQSTITALEISTSPANILYYGTSDGWVYRIENCNTGDPIPEDIWTGKGLSDSAYVSCIAVNPTDTDELIVVFSNYEVKSLFYSENGGESWTDISGNLEQYPDGTGDGPSTRWAEILPAGNSTYYFIATSTGLYSTTSLNGTSTVWEQEGYNTIGNVVVDMIDSRVSDGYIVLGTHGNGVYSGSIQSPVSVENNNNQIPQQYELYQNYPNPFNPETTIKFSIPKLEHVKLEIYSITGRLVKVIADRQYPAGENAIRWNGTNSVGAKVASGIYIYRIQAGNFTATKRMMLIK
ncbi:MAG: T9SS type A sorting domain-containing protein [bacterium]|nr:T9SS type A sorting domain-containing protein [bacterium]